LDWGSHFSECASASKVLIRHSMSQVRAWSYHFLLTSSACSVTSVTNVPFLCFHSTLP